MTIQANQGFGVSVFGGGGGSTSPGGSSGQVQYNNGGSFGGMSGTTWTDASQSLAIASTGTGTGVTTSSPVLNLTQTWNAGAVTFTGLKFNATDTASASGSLLLDLQVGGASRFALGKNGTGSFLGGLRLGYAGTVNYPIDIYNYDTAIQMVAGFYLGWASSTTNPATSDLILRRAAAATLQLGAADAAAPVAQTFKVQGVVAGTTNTAGANFTIQGSQGTGTGAGGSIIFQVAPAGSSGTAQNAYSTALTIAPGGIATATGTSSPAFVANNTTGSSKAAAITAGAGASVFLFDDTGIFGIYSNLKSRIIGTQPNSSATGQMIITTSSRAIVGSGGAFAFDSTSDPANNTPDVFLNRDAANTLALRNGGTSGAQVPQTFRVYTFYTDASNYKRLALLSSPYSDSRVEIKAESAGTGGTSDLSLASANGQLYFVTNANTRWNMDTSGHFLAAADNTYDIGASGANRPRNIYVATSVRTDSFYTTSTAGFYYILNRFSLQSAADGTVYFTNAAGTDFGRLQFGGTTSSFPALKRISSGNCLQVIAADNTASAGFIVGNQALATSATDGFLYVPTCAGTPTGTPTTQTGTAPIVVDTTNNKLYFYSGGQWRDAGP